MDLHRASKVPDWEVIPPHKRNVWQHMAADTYGVGTPGNFLSVSGFLCVLAGLWIVVAGSLFAGTVLVSVGRLADIADGIIAHRTGTKSPLGRLLDASLDKTGAYLALIIFTLRGVLPPAVAIAIALPNLVTMFVSSYAPWRHIFLNPSLAGKLAAGGYWTAIIAFVADEIAKDGTPAYVYHGLRLVSYGIAVVSVTIGIYATLGYARIVKRAPPHRPRQDTV